MTSATSKLICPACRAGRVRIFYEALSAPVNSVRLVSSREEAVGFPTGDVRLGFCHECGFIYNTAFERRLVEYSSRCEESQGFSPFFRAWHEDLAQRLIDRHSLYGKKIIEIGCGKGEFLALLCGLGGNEGIGFDPAYVPERITRQAASRIKFLPEFYGEKDSELNTDFLCCKMTLEHIADTADFAEMVHRSLRKSPDARVFFQVPNVCRVLEEEAFWDIYYEHCSYFSPGSLARLFGKVGFDVLTVGREYRDQYLTIEARVGNGTPCPFAAEDDVASLETLVKTFASRVPRQIAQWRKRLEGYRAKGVKTVVWGAGSKGVTFLSTLNVTGAVEFVVDINPNMSGHYLAKSGTEIVGPSFLRDYRPDVVIVMNPVYQKEIVGDLARYGLSPEVISTS
ncbi:MAG: methyltransferase domain-containing protein [Deltaproteobacteria bacterium]|nr:methyltransferase domain-containing protein [Deltaproteobacteria bacterium]